MAESLSTTIHDVLTPLTGARQSIRWQNKGAAFSPAWPRDAGRDIDGSALWVLPALYDADAHMPLVPFGFRHADLQIALAGGIGQVNVAIPWHLIRGLDVKAFAADIAREQAVKLIPLLSVSDEDSRDFPAWLKDNRGVYDEVFRPLCKFYSTDPNLERNLEAMWEAGLKPMIWNSSQEDLEKVIKLAANRPIHFRHATSAAMVAAMRQVSAATVQTSPHFLLPLVPGKAETLIVLPPLPPESVSRTLAEVFPDKVDMIASDHNALQEDGRATAFGLQCQQHFLPSLLAIAETFGWALGDILHKAIGAPAAIFNVAPPEQILLVDPSFTETVKLWPGQDPERAAFEGLKFKGRVMAMLSADRVELV